MKPGVLYDDACVISFVEDCITSINYNMSHTSIHDPEFAHLSTQKFTMEQLLQELNRHQDIPAIILVQELIANADMCTGESDRTSLILKSPEMPPSQFWTVFILKFERRTP